jgi:hypothetical protein
VNGIAVQLKVYRPHPPNYVLHGIDKTKKRSVPVKTEELPLYVSGERKGSQSLLVSTNDMGQHEMKATLARKKHLLWMLTRTVQTECQNTK